MAYHHFRLVKSPPGPGEYLEWQPSADLLPLLDDTADLLFRLVDSMPSYYQNLGMPGCGFDETGITLIPPSSLPILEQAAQELFPYWGDESLLSLAQLCREGMASSSFLLHFGL